MPGLQLPADVFQTHPVPGCRHESEVDEVGGLVGGALRVRGFRKLPCLFQEFRSEKLGVSQCARGA